MKTMAMLCALAMWSFAGVRSFAQEPDDLQTLTFNDAHYHLTNYVQEGPSIQDYLKIMGSRVGRSTLFGIPLQQQWAYRVSGDFAPKYYLESDAPLYYYSFVDAAIAMAYRSLEPAQRKRFDPMITGFNPTDMYAVDHIRRVLRIFPGVFSGIGEFTIHKEFVSAKVAGGAASLLDPAVDRILSFAGEVGLVALIHNDIQMPFSKEKDALVYYEQLLSLFRRHPKTTIIWAHIGLGRVIQPVADQAALIEKLLEEPALKHVYLDISWNELAKYLNATPETAQRVARVINRYPDRFLFGTDEVASRDSQSHFKIVEGYSRLWKLLEPATSRKLRLENYTRLFDRARSKVREWERTNL